MLPNPALKGCIAQCTDTLPWINLTDMLAVYNQYKFIVLQNTLIQCISNPAPKGFTETPILFVGRISNTKINFVTKFFLQYCLHLICGMSV